MVPNFNLNYLSCMFLDIARFETTTTIRILFVCEKGRESELNVQRSSRTKATVTLAPMESSQVEYFKLYLTVCIMANFHKGSY